MLTVIGLSSLLDICVKAVAKASEVEVFDSFKVVLLEVIQDASEADGFYLAFSFDGLLSKLRTQVIDQSDTVPAEDVVVQHEEKHHLCPFFNSFSQPLHFVSCLSDHLVLGWKHKDRQRAGWFNVILRYSSFSSSRTTMISISSSLLSIASVRSRRAVVSLPLLGIIIGGFLIVFFTVGAPSTPLVWRFHLERIFDFLRKSTHPLSQLLWIINFI